MASKTTGTKKNAKQSTAKKRQPTKKTSAKSAKSAKTTRKNTTSKAVPQEESFLATEILIWVTLAVGILLTISNFGLAGAFGRKIAALQQGMMGWMAYVFPLLLFCGVAFVVSNKGNRIAYIKTVAGVVLLVQCCVLFELIDEKGGSVGKAIAVRLVPAIGKVGTYVVVIILMVICVVLITEKSILKGMKIGGEKAYDRAREDMQKRKEEAEERAKKALRMVGMGEEYDKCSPFELSGGQKRRVAIAGVLAMDPEVLILDEPTAGLDPRGRDEILDQISYLQKERGITVILVSHSMEDVARYVDRLIVMNQGEVRFDGTPKEVFRHYKELEEIGLAAPQVTYLMQELKEKGASVDTEATTVEEAAETIEKWLRQR